MYAGFKADRPQSIDGIESSASTVRQALLLADDGSVDMLQLFENLWDLRVETPVGVIRAMPSVAEQLRNAAPAETRFDPQTGRVVMELTDRTYCGLEHRDDYLHRRARFTVAHELGHIVLHMAQLIRLAEFHPSHAGLLRVTRSNFPLYWDTEWQAETFAAAFLAPRAALLRMAGSRKVSVETVMEAFGLSRPAAQIRLDKLHLREAPM